MDRGAVHLDKVEITILDGPTTLADMGFVEEMTGILDAIPEGWSATALLRHPGPRRRRPRRERDRAGAHSTDDAQAAVTTMSHHVLLIDGTKAVTSEVANRQGPTIVFARTQLGTDRIAARAAGGRPRHPPPRRSVAGCPATGCSAPSVRSRIPVLVATDVAARGIPSTMSVSSQVDPPRDPGLSPPLGSHGPRRESGAVVTPRAAAPEADDGRLLEQAGVDTPPPCGSKPGDANVLATGGSAPSGQPIPEEQFQPLIEAAPRRSSGAPHPGAPVASTTAAATVVVRVRAVARAVDRHNGR